MSKLLALAWNHLRIEFQDRSTLIFFLVLPILFTVVIGSALGGSASTGDSRIPLLVADQDNTSLSTELRSTLAASTVLRVDVQSPDQAQRSFDDQQAPALLIIPTGFGEALLVGQPFDLNLRTAPNDTRVLAVQQAVRAAVDQTDNAITTARTSVEEAEKIKPFADATARQAYFDQSLTMARNVLKTPPARVDSSEAALQVADGFAQSSPGQLITWVLTTLLGVSGFLVYERVGGTARRLAATPTSRATILTGNLLGRLAMGLVQIVLLIGFGALFLNVNWGRSPAALIVLSLTFALSAVAFGVMLATFARTMSQANSLSIMFSMLLAALGGCWWPLEITPPIYQTVVKVLPSTWAMIGFTDVIVRGRGLIDILPIAGILLLFSVVFLAIGIRRLRFD
jgi:ABC-2 type transport system permease protein